MLSIGKLTPGRAGYYSAQLPGGADEYYTRNTGVEQPAVWLGSAAGRLGLAGPVAAAQFRAVLDACHPVTGEPLGIPRTTARRLAGFDLCLSAPKSVSVAWALAPPEVADRIAAAHDRAVAQSVEAFEVEVVRARRGKRAATLIDTDGVAAAAFGHRSSRRGDPQIHTHVVVPNLTVDGTGRWSALAGDRVYRWAKTLGYLYQAALRAELAETLDIAWGPVRNGSAEIAGVDSRLVEAFSKRRAEILDALRAVGGRSAQAAQTATLATRPAKDHTIDIDTLRDRWHDEAAALGCELPHVRQVGPDVRLAAHTKDLAPELFGPEGLTANASTFDRRDVLRAVAAAHPDGIRVSGARAGTDRLLARPEVVALGSDGPAGPRYSTAELVGVEARLVDRARRQTDAHLGIAGHDAVRAALAERPSLTGEQRQMVASLTASGAGVEVVVGRAGSGKTFALDAARAAWEASGHQVIGCALAARAAVELQAGSGIASGTVDRLVADLDRPGPLSLLRPRTVVVVDEAAMIGTRKLARLLEHAEARQAKVVLVGDHHQLPEIAAGGAFAALIDAVPTTELAGNRRQAQAWERTALSELRAGSVAAGVDAYRKAGRITLAETAEAARGRMVEDWWAACSGGQDAAMYALRRSDVEDLNRRARQRMADAGLLGPDTLSPDTLGTAGRDFAAGDQVVCLRNDRRLGVRNGTRSTIAALEPATGGVRLEDGTRLPAAYLEAGHLDYGYATTIHKAQGATVDRAFLLGSEGLYREAGYVGLSRARQRSDLYIVAPPPGRHDDSPGVDPVADTIRRLGASRAQTLAADQLYPEPSRPEPGHPDPLQPDARGAGTRRSAILADPDPWMIDVLGPPPLERDSQDRWARNVERIAAYRDIYQISDAADPLGPRPAEPTQRRAWDLARLGVDEHRRSLDLEVEGLHL